MERGVEPGCGRDRSGEEEARRLEAGSEHTERPSEAHLKQLEYHSQAPHSKTRRRGAGKRAEQEQMAGEEPTARARAELCNPPLNLQ